MSSQPSVTVVVPTVGRDSLVRALGSVRDQRYDGPVQIIVVGPEEALAGTEPEHDTTLVSTGGRVNGSRARNLGVDAAEGELIAFLDDDDRWDPHKLSTQVVKAGDLREAGLLPIVSCRHRLVDELDQSRVRPGPDDIYAGGDVAQYLFRRRSTSGSRASIYTSSIVAPRELCELVPWGEHLKRHQDWDWLIRATRIPNAALVQDPRPLVDIFTGTGTSVSAATDWLMSLQWADDQLVEDQKTYVDFLSAQTLRYAINARSAEGVQLVVGRILAAGERPSITNVAIGAAGLLPRRTLERLLFKSLPWNS